jgi:hypothetical protein
MKEEGLPAQPPPCLLPTTHHPSMLKNPTTNTATKPPCRPHPTKINANHNHPASSYKNHYPIPSQSFPQSLLQTSELQTSFQHQHQHHHYTNTDTHSQTKTAPCPPVLLQVLLSQFALPAGPLLPIPVLKTLLLN